MPGANEFFELFGDITIGTILKYALAIFFVVYIAKQVKSYFIEKKKLDIEKATIEKQRDKDLSEALAGVREYPKYRQQSIRIQELLEGEIQELRDEVKEVKTMQENQTERFDKIEEDTKRRERNKIRNTLLSNYRYYTNPETNPTHSWTRVESDTFWELFKEYEENGGNGLLHDVVQPEMNKLIIIEHEPTKK